MSSEWPEEPHLRSEPCTLSPASPKPVHFPTPSNITVLDKQMDVTFNQTEIHMNDPAMHDTEVRPDFWRDPNEPNVMDNHASPYSTGEGDAAVNVARGTGEEQPGSVPTNGVERSIETANVPASDSQTLSLSNFASFDANANSEATPASQPTDSLQPTPHPNVSAAATTSPSLPAQSAEVNVPSTNSPQEDTGNGPVDFQSLLDTLQNAPASATVANAHVSSADDLNNTTTAPPSQAQTQHHQENTASTPHTLPPGVDSLDPPLSASGLGAPPTGLPPRPPPQEQPLINPNYVHSQHIRDYHPHAAHPAFQPHTRSASGSGQGTAADPQSRNFVPPVSSSPGAGGAEGDTLQSPSGVANSSTQQSGSVPAGAFGTWGEGGGVGHVATPHMPQGAPFTGPQTPTDNRHESRPRDGREQGHASPEDTPWSPETQRKYDRFIENERGYVSEGRWEQFPPGSRLFVGNLSSEKVTKRDIFHVFHTYGELAQISIKQAYGFVQFLRAEDCSQALMREQGTQIRDKKIHLEVSKPQKNRPQANNRRSRSPPDHGRGGRPGGNDVDRYVSGGRGGNNRNGRDGYRPGVRSPSPPPRGFRDRYDDRHRPRSRSPGYGRGGGSRYRSPSPRRDAEDELPLPWRNSRDVPDVQIVVFDQLERDFIAWVEHGFASKGVRVDVVLLSPRLNEQAVIRRQIMEGVLAVVKLTHRNQHSARIGLQVFKRPAGADLSAVRDVRFEEYDMLEPNIAAEVVLREKSTAQPQQTPAPYAGYGSYPSAQQPPYGAQTYATPQQPQQSGYQPPAYGAQQPPYSSTSQQPSNPASQPNLQHLISTLDPANLQSLLSAMNANPPAGGGGVSHPDPRQQHQQQQANAYAALQGNPAMAAGWVAQAQAQQQQQQQTSSAGGGVDMQDILAKLGGRGAGR